MREVAKNTKRVKEATKNKEERGYHTTFLESRETSI